MSNDVTEPIQYSLGQPPQRTGLGGFSMKATLIVATGFFTFLVLQLMGLAKLGFTVVLPATAVAAVIAAVNRPYPRRTPQIADSAGASLSPKEFEYSRFIRIS